MNSMRNVCDNWLVRDSVNHELDDKIMSIVDTFLDDGLDENNTEMVLNVLQEFVDISGWTADEADHAIESIQLMCAIQFANRQGADVDAASVIDFLNREYQ